MFSFMPKAPPMSGDVTRTLCSGMSQMPAVHILHLEWRLMRVDDVQRALARIEVRDQAARFERHRHLALEPQHLFDDDIGLRPGLFRLALR